MLCKTFTRDLEESKPPNKKPYPYSINPKTMNLFDAIPQIVKERYDGYTVGDSIATKDILETVSIVIDRCSTQPKT